MSPSPYYAISPHPLAPILSDKRKAGLYLEQLASEMRSGHPIQTEEFRDLMRQACYVSLFFFLTAVASYAGPFDKLNTSLHREMANFVQLYCVPPNKVALFVSRFHYKTTICSIGHNSWRALRDPNTRLRINASTQEKSEEILEPIERIFDSNELFMWLFGNPDDPWGSYVPASSSVTGWNKREMTLPNRTRYYKEPTIKVGSSGAASEGDHHEGITHEDIIGQRSLNAARQSNVEMQNVTNHWQTDNDTLILDAMSTWILTIGTRYGLDDTYEEIMGNMKRLYGYRRILELGDYEEREDAEWIVYYRLVKEWDDKKQKEEIIFPEAITEQYLVNMLKNNPWAYWTQMMNLPQESSLVEFAKFDVKECELYWKEGQPYVRWEREGGVWKKERHLGEFDVTMGVDPAGTEKYVSAKTSMSAVSVVAQNFEREKFLLWQKAGYVSILVMFDWIFEASEAFKGFVRVCVFEAAAYQKVLEPLAVRERIMRQKYVGFDSISAVGDKDANIRATAGSDLERGLVYSVAGTTQFRAEVKGFPQMKMKDCLDSYCLAVKVSNAPESPEQKKMRKRQSNRFKRRQASLVGW